MKFNNDFYKSKYFWLGLVGISFTAGFPWSNVCSVQGIFYLIIIVIGATSMIGSVFNFSRYFS
ncbi:hypothetical protein LBO01_13730 [Companilactobacillus paralimentarius]|nr:hypothetical protein LBO01_13730 [Companilactobacillus paralimentarius]